MSSDEQRIAAALQAASLGLRIVILNNADGDPDRRKLPFGKGWGIKATDDEEILLRRFEKRPNANIGVLLGKYPAGSKIPGVIDVEFDSEEGRAAADRIFGSNTFTPTYKSARSVHRLFLWNDDFPPQQKLAIEGLEVRLGGGAKQTHSVMPPSTHSDGRDYQWLPGLSIGEVELAEVPEILAVQFTNVEAELEAAGLTGAASSGSGKSEEHWESIRHGVAEGSRNASLCSLVGRWAANCVHLDADAAADLRERAVAWGQKCTPPLPPKECESVARNVIARDRKRRAEEESVATVTACLRMAEPDHPEIVVDSVAVAITSDGDDDGKRRRIDLAHDSGRTDAANAIRFVDRYHAELIYVPQWAKWLTWDGRRWVDDSGVGVRQRAKRYAKSLWGELAKLAPKLKRDQLGVIQTFVRNSNGRRKIEDFVALASVDERVVCSVDQLNQNPNLLNVENGTLDLLSGALRPHDPKDRITQLASVSYDPTAECRKWLDTLSLIMDGDAELIQYVQRLLGYSISGDTGEHILPIAYGSGCNGKSTVWNVIHDLLGDYASLASDGLLLGDRSNHPTEKAALYQKRFVAISEPERGVKLRESRVKELTGDRTITARKMHQDFWSFTRTHTFWLSTNHLPSIDGTDDGIWRRVKLIPFTVDIRKRVEPITDFDNWLVEHEAAGILAWLVRGHIDWRRNGLPEPKAVADATRSYRDDSDPLGDFIAEHCYLSPNAITTASDLYRVYEANYGGKWTRTAFGRAMAERFAKAKPKNGPHRDKIVYCGIGIRPFAGFADDTGDIPEIRGNLGLGPVGTSYLESPQSLANL